MRKMSKCALLLALAGGTLFGGCLGGLGSKNILTGTALYIGLSYVLDNDSTFDLFESGDVATTTP